jgi:hypothetical protein
VSKQFNTVQAAEYLGLSPGTLEVWRCHGRGPRYIKLGRRVVYTLDDLDMFIFYSRVQTVDSHHDDGGAR